MYIIHENGNVKTLFGNESDIPTELQAQTILVNGELPVIENLLGKQGEYFYNGTSIEVKYTNRELTNIERLTQMENVIYEAILGGKL